MRPFYVPSLMGFDAGAHPRTPCPRGTRAFLSPWKARPSLQHGPLPGLASGSRSLPSAT